MNHLSLATPVVSSNNTAPSNGINIDANEVLKEYGLDEIIEEANVVQQGDTTIVVPNNSNNMLEPPAISAPNSDAESLFEAILNDTPSGEEISSANSVFVGEEFSPESVRDATYNLTITTTNSAEDSDEEDEDEDENEDEDEHAESVESVFVETANQLLNADNEAVVADANTASTTSNSDRLSTEEAIDRLPLNSAEFKINNSTARFSGAAWYSAVQRSKVVIAGLGGIGSYVLFCLSRMKPYQIVMYDDDVVEEVNLSGQLYSKSMIGSPKVDAMAHLAQDFSMYNTVVAIPQKFTKDTPAEDIMICGFDNMEARSVYFNAWVNHVLHHSNPEKCLFIDGRLAMEEFQVFCLTGTDTYNINRYNKECLFRDVDVDPTLCSMRQTTYCSNMIGSVIVNLFTNFIANSLHPAVERDLPFKTYYNASLMYFKTET